MDARLDTALHWSLALCSEAAVQVAWGGEIITVHYQACMCLWIVFKVRSSLLMSF